MRLNTGSLTDTVTVEPRLGRGGAGVQYGPAKQVRVLLNDTYKLVHTTEAEQTPVDVLMMCRPEVVFAFGDRVTLPNSRVVTVRSVNQVKWGRRVQFVEVLAG